MGHALAPEDTYEKRIDSDNLNIKLSFVVFVLELCRERVVIGFFIFRMPTPVVLIYVISINDSRLLNMVTGLCGSHVSVLAF